MSSSPPLLWLKQIDDHDRQLVGDLAVKLGQLVRHGFSLPPGFVISDTAVDEVTSNQHLISEINAILKPISFKKPEQMVKPAAILQQLIANISIPHHLEQQIINHYLKLKASWFNHPRVIVKGQFLNHHHAAHSHFAPLLVKGEANLFLAIKQNWAAWFSAQLISQRLKEHQPQLPIKLAILIQVYIPPVVSGQMITVNPVSGQKNSLIIKAVYGHTNWAGAPNIFFDHYQVNKLYHLIIDKQITPQPSRLTLIDGHAKSQPVPKTLRDQPKLTDEQILTLASLGKKLEQHFLAPLQINWLLHQGNFYLTSVKPLETIVTREKTTGVPQLKHIVIQPPAPTEQPPTPPTKTATQLTAWLTHPDQPVSIAALPIDGVGMLAGETLLHQLAAHPLELIHQGNSRSATSIIEATLTAVCQAFQPRPVIYRLSNLTTAQYQHLIKGHLWETEEPNPLLGNRGAFRYLHQPKVIQFELDAISQVRQAHRYTNLQLWLPWVRSVSELNELKKLLAGHELSRGGSYKLWLGVTTPANVLLLEDFAPVGIDGVIIDLDALSQLTLGIDHQVSEVTRSANSSFLAVEWLAAKAIKDAHHLKLPTAAFSTTLADQSDLIEKLVHWGVDQLIVPPSALDRIRDLVAYAEQRLIGAHGSAT